MTAESDASYVGNGLVSGGSESFFGPLAEERASARLEAWAPSRSPCFETAAHHHQPFSLCLLADIAGAHL